MNKKIFTILRSKNCVYLDYDVEYVVMIHISEQVKLAEL